MRVLQFGDLHHDPATSENTTRAMEQLLTAAKSWKPDLIVNTGDLVMKRGSVLPQIGYELRQWHDELAKVAPVLVVAGNHDLPSRGGDVGSVVGVLGHSREGLILVERPAVVRMNDVPFLCVPYPPVDPAEMSQQERNEHLEAVIRGLAADAAPCVLVYHGSIAGALTGTEAEMGFDRDCAIREDRLPENIKAVMAGHIHKPQEVGRAVYAGSPCPLNFGEEQHEHGYVVWHQELGGAWSGRFQPLMPARSYWTVDVREAADPLEAFDAKLEQTPKRGAVTCRVLYRVRRGVEAATLADQIRRHAAAAGVDQVRLVPEMIADERPALQVNFDDVRGSLEWWMSVNTLDDDLKARVRDCEEKAAAELAPKLLEMVGRGSYRLVAAEWMNFRSLGIGRWGDEQLGTLVCIEGENASGKSNLAEIEAFALWGRSPRGRVTLADLPRRGCDACSVTVWVDHETGHYKVRREVTVNARGVGAAKVTVFKRDGQCYAQLPMQQAESQAFIEAMVGSWEMYLATRFASQGDIDRLLSMRPGDLKDVFQESAALDQYAAREGLAATWEPRVKQAFLEAEATLNAARDAAHAAKEELERAKHEELSAACDISMVDSKIRDAEKHLASKREAHAAAKAAFDQSAQVRARYDELARRHRDAVDAHKELKAKHEAIELERAKVLRSLETARSEFVGIDTRDDSSVGLALGEQLEARERLRRFEADAYAEDRKATDECDAALRLVDEQLAMAEQNLKDLIRSQAAEDARFHAELRAFEARREVLEQLESKSHLVLFAEKCEPCPLAKAAFDAGKALMALKPPSGDELAHLTSDLITTRDYAATFHVKRSEAMDRKRQMLHALAEARASGYNLLLHETGVADGKVERAQEQHRRYELRLARARELEAQISTAETRADEMLERLRDSQRAMDNAAAAEAAAEVARLAATEPLTSADLAVRLGTAATEERIAADDLEQMRVRRQGHERRLGQAEEQVRAAKERSKVPDAVYELFQKHQLSLAAVQLYRRATGRDGIPFNRVQESIAQVQDWANEFLGLGDLRLLIESSRETQAGDKKDEVVARYSNRFGQHELSAASGYERVALGYALRAAMAKLQAAARGIRVGHWIADEGWGAFDEANLVQGQAMLHRLSQEFERVFFISHVTAIRSVADTKMRVEVDAVNGSSVTISR